jgi:hypothetical protein
MQQSQFEQERMIALSLAPDKQDFPGIDGISESGRPISLKYVTATSRKTLKDRIEEIGERATVAKNGSLPTLVDIDGMITCENFSKAEIISAIDEVITENRDLMKIVKRIFIEGSDENGWYEIIIPK